MAASARAKALKVLALTLVLALALTVALKVSQLPKKSVLAHKSLTPPTRQLYSKPQDTEGDSAHTQGEQ
ncbi:hypothetical protein AWZ03_001696 [Drosophila navojoa]|uniref:Uncharacterized protein n=1 Tax=Drosophila navojoa TaxID=7232 RepID=A0A484BT87_DRONA|nr:hypothetical protein AWZ03_001696 [Drosophila navojoa]